MKQPLPFRKRLRIWMIENDKTLRQFAKEVGIHHQTLSSYLNGRPIGYRVVAHRISELTGFDIEDVMSAGTDDEINAA